jgi:hypothetical protein
MCFVMMAGVGAAGWASERKGGGGLNKGVCRMGVYFLGAAGSIWDHCIEQWIGVQLPGNAVDLSRSCMAAPLAIASF